MLVSPLVVLLIHSDLVQSLTGEYCIRLPEQCAKTGEPECAAESTSPLTNHGTYIDKNVTVSGRECQNWNIHSPHTHLWLTNETRRMWRNPGNGTSPWCYTTDPSTRWEYCYDTCTPKQYASDLEAECDKLIHAFYDGMSCIVGSIDLKTHTDAKTNCNKLPNGRLTFILTKQEWSMNR